MPPYRVIHLTIQIGKGVIFLFQVGCSALLVQFKRRAYKNMKKNENYLLSRENCMTIVK